jgi:hypothetical protein
MVTAAEYRPYIDERERGHIWFPEEGVEVWITGTVIAGPQVEYEDSEPILGEPYLSRGDSFRVRVRGVRRDGPLDLLIVMHTDSGCGPMPPLWLRHLRVGALVQVRLLILASEDLARLHSGDDEFMALTVRVLSDEDGRFPGDGEERTP